MALTQASNWPVIERKVSTDNGTVYVRMPILSETVNRLGIDDGLRAFRPAWRQKEALAEIAALDDSWVVAAVFQDNIVGYITFHPPEEFERWGQTHLKEIIELGAIEVAPAFRHIGLGKIMMETAFANKAVDDLIIISTEYYWHWDLEGTGLNVWEYQRVMTRLMESVGMSKRATNDLEISAHPANMLMARVGANVPPGVEEVFNKLLVR